MVGHPDCALGIQGHTETSFLKVDIQPGKFQSILRSVIITLHTSAVLLRDISHLHFFTVWSFGYML